MKRTLLASLLAFAASPMLALANADAIYFGGDILTLNDALPTAEALAVKDGEIVAIGSTVKVTEEHKGAQTNLIDLNGQTLLPGFIDSHSHLTAVGLKRSTVALDPAPAGNVTSIKDIQRNLGFALAKRPQGSQDWLVGMNYDNVMLEDGRHPTRHDLDQVSTEVPLLVAHFSGHQGVANSKLLEILGIDENTPNPQGGVIQREAGSQVPNGILEEYAFLPALVHYISTLGLDPDKTRPDNYLEQLMVGFMISAQKDYAAAGYTTATDMGLLPNTVALLSGLADNGALYIDIAGAPYMKGEASVKDVIPLYSEEYNNHFRIAGGKATIDGGSPGRTAYLREPYYVQLEGEKDYVGYTAMQPTTLEQHVLEYYEADIPIFVHALGDGAVDIALDGIEKAEKAYPGKDRRTQLIHVQQIQEDQLKRTKDLGATITFQMTHAFYNADFHAKNIFGPERTHRLLPVNSALKHGISSTIHHDAPVHPVNQMDLVWSAVNRTSRSGRIWGEDERLTALEALKASTINAAYQLREEDRKGTLEVGKLADMVILEQNPLTADPQTLKDIQIVETIKEGKTVFSAQ
ncbi:amidohydrolase [Vibrio sp. WXL103]|uniref:amidohydrolase n=1 Tax=unclassified Vibrio TaxID=2614977 RepID=UPI003EC4AA6E